MPILNKDMQVCMSLAARPSNIGTRFHNFLYDELGLNFIYKAFTTDDLAGAVAGIRALGIRGCSVSMPFKEAIIPLVDVVEESAAAIDSVNTVLNDGGVLTASNTDYEAVAALLATHEVDPASSVVLRGSGGMAKAVVAAFRGAGFEDLTVVARNETAGPALATQYGYRWAPSLDALAGGGGVAGGVAGVGGGDGPGVTAGRADVLVNVTPIGMHGDAADEQAFDDTWIDAATTVFDVVAFPSETPFVRAGRTAGKRIITGAEVIALQAARQFERYTGVALTDDQVRRASEFSRAE